MLHLYQGNRLEHLAEQLAAVLARPLADPFAAERLVVPHHGMGRWLALEIAGRLGIWANVRIDLPAGFVWELFGRVLEGVPRENRFVPSVLAWRLFALLPTLAGEPGFAALGRYLTDPDELKRFQLAERLAQTFDRYLVFRRDWVLAWEHGRPAVEGDDWQAALWRRLATPEAGPHWVHLQERFFAAAEAGRLEQLPLPERVVLFGLSSLSPGYLEILHRLAQHCELHLFLLNPCAEFWPDLVAEREKARLEGSAPAEELHLEVGQPLLASLGRQGRGLFRAIAELDPGSWERFVPAPEGTLLGRLQNDILEPTRRDGREPTPLPAGDRSLQFHACHSPMREVEILYDQLLDLFAGDPTLSPSDVRVATPEVDRYGPLIEAVFGEPGDRPPLPFGQSDRAASAEAPLAAALFDLLRVARGRFDVNGVLALLETPALRRRFGIGEADLPRLAAWVAESGVRWGRDGAARAALGLPAEEQNTWGAGLRRMLLGYALPGEGRHTFAGILPCDAIEGSAAALLGGLAEFLDRLAGLEQRLAGARGIEEWCGFLAGLLGELFDPDEGEGLQLQAIRDALDGLAEEARLAGFGGPVGLSVLEHLLGKRLQAPAGGRILGQGITFCALTPLRALPFRVVCLIGMNDGVFPRDHRPPGFDLIARHPRGDDRTLRDDDRYLFLETLLSARQTLYLSWVGQQINDNSPLPPSVLVSELLDCLAADYRSDHSQGVAGALVLRHPLQPFSPRYFAGEPGLFCYSPGLAEAARALGAPRPPAPFLAAPLPELEPEWLEPTLEGLIRFFAHPVRGFLQQRLKVRLEEGEGVLEDREPFALERFEGNALCTRLLDAQGDKPAELLALERARGVLPHGGWGERVFSEVLQKSGGLAERLAAEEPGESLPPLELEFRHGAMRLHGRLDGVHSGGLFRYSVDKLFDYELVGLWISHLALNLVRPAGVQPVSRFLDKEGLYRLIPVADPALRLGELLDLYREGLTRPLHLFVKSGRAYQRVIRDGKGEQGALQAARKLWSEGDWPEGANPYHRLAFRDGDPLDSEFEALCGRLFGPLYDHLEEG